MSILGAYDGLQMASVVIENTQSSQTTIISLGKTQGNPTKVSSAPPSENEHDSLIELSSGLGGDRNI